MGKLWQRTVGNDGQSQLQEVGLDGLKVAGPTLVYLSGFLTNNNRPDYIAGGIKRMEELLKDRTAARPQIYAWSHSGLRNLFNLAAYNMFPGSRASKAGRDLASAVVMPLVSAQGKPLPLDEARQNLRNVTFFGYSAGSIVAQETFNASLKMMKAIGFKEPEARAALQEVVLLSAGTISRPSKERDRFSTVYLVASNDRINRFKNWIWGTLGTALRSAFGNYARDKKQKELTVRPLSETSLFISTSVRPSLYEWKYDADGNRAAKKEFPALYPKWTLRRSYHELPHYITTDDTNNSFARIALYTLINALDRTASVQPLRLLEPPANDTSSAEAQASYRARLQQALRPAPAKLG
jgi:hypothetical protein